MKNGLSVRLTLHRNSNRYVSREAKRKELMKRHQIESCSSSESVVRRDSSSTFRAVTVTTHIRMLKSWRWWIGQAPGLGILRLGWCVKLALWCGMCSEVIRWVSIGKVKDWDVAVSISPGVARKHEILALCTFWSIMWIKIYRFSN